MSPRWGFYLVFAAAVVGHTHHFGGELGYDVYEVRLGGHDLVDVFVGHRGFIATTTDEAHAEVLQDLAHLLLAHAFDGLGPTHLSAGAVGSGMQG